MKKFSFTIKGHRTSVSLEDEFYEVLQNLAKNAGVPLAQIVAEIDENREPEQNLSSALRVAALKSLKPQP